MAKNRLPSPSNQVLTVGEAAAILRISISSVVRMTTDGRLRRVPGIRRLLVTRASLDALLHGEDREKRG